MIIKKIFPLILTSMLIFPLNVWAGNSNRNNHPAKTERTEAKEKSVVFGWIDGDGHYIEHGGQKIGGDGTKFHPLVSVLYKSGGIEFHKPDPDTLKTPYHVYNTFKKDNPGFDVVSQTEYVDPHGVDHEEMYGNISEKFSSDSDFFSNSRDGLDDFPKKKNVSIIKHFYSFFSGDDWGKHIISKNMLKKSIGKIEAESGVIVRRITDIDRNGNCELWITVGLSYSSIGRMIYEQNKDRTSWNRIAYQCFLCD